MKRSEIQRFHVFNNVESIFVLSFLFIISFIQLNFNSIWNGIKSQQQQKEKRQRCTLIWSVSKFFCVHLFHLKCFDLNKTIRGNYELFPFELITIEGDLLLFLNEFHFWRNVSSLNSWRYSSRDKHYKKDENLIKTGKERDMQT